MTGRPLLVYVARADGPIDHTDILGFGDLLEEHDHPNADLLLQSPGGDIDRAEKIVVMCRSRCKGFRVIVPESAKSAATLIAIASDQIVMSDTSELGPVDPQIRIPTSGGYEYRPAQSILDGLKSIKDEAKEAGNVLSPAYYPLLQQLDPALIDFCNKAIKRSERFAIKWLEKYMLKNSPEEAKKIAKKLLDVAEYLSHGAVIDHLEAKKIGLNVLFLEPSSELWQALWRLYCSYEVALNRGGAGNKIFESSKVSLVL